MIIIKCKNKCSLNFILDDLSKYDIKWWSGNKLEDVNPYNILNENDTIYILVNENKTIEWTQTIPFKYNSIKVLCFHDELISALNKVFKNDNKNGKFEFNDLIIKCSRSIMFSHIIDRLEDYDIKWFDGMKLKDYNPYVSRHLHDEQTIYLTLYKNDRKIKWCDSIMAAPTNSNVISTFSELNLILKEMFLKKPFEDLKCEELKCVDCPFNTLHCEFIKDNNQPFGKCLNEIIDTFETAKEIYNQEEEDDDEE